MSDSANQAESDQVDAGLFKRGGGKRDAAAPPPAPSGAGNSAAEQQLVEYKMNHPKRGWCIIFNQVEFDPRTFQSQRVGSDVDADNLERSFKNLGFSVSPFRNLTLKDMLSVMQETAAKDHSNSDCLAVVLLSHGENGSVYGYDGTIQLERLARYLRPDRCPSLAGKPKLFFIQACRGTKYDKGHEVADGDGAGEDQSDSGKLSRIPLESDFLYFYSTPPGYYSWRNDVQGSWFVQQLCLALKNSGDSMELAHLLLIVKRSVAANFQSNTNEENTSGMKQIPVVVSTLRKMLYFRRK